jgi:DNA-directed RNA polymerase specialized sigma24 family protein
MLESVRPFVKSQVRAAGIYESDIDDTIQDLTLKLWEATLRFDPSRGVKWITFVGGIVRRELGSHKKASIKKVNPLLVGEHDEFDDLCSSLDLGSEAEEETSVDGATASQIAALAGPMLSALTPWEKELFTLLAIEGLDGPQVSERTGKKLSLIEISTRALVVKLCKNGLVPEELVGRFKTWKAQDAICPARKAFVSHSDPRNDPAKLEKAKERLRATGTAKRLQERKAKILELLKGSPAGLPFESLCRRGSSRLMREAVKGLLEAGRIAELGDDIFTLAS